ncbi:hypothetical protein RAS1_35160 [Phycisphaerae bacterium RAS1]|nr:hypothetical protein RAS1_35160 [Phycisphaerae bacterium RAS1]
MRRLLLVLAIPFCLASLCGGCPAGGAGDAATADQSAAADAVNDEATGGDQVSGATAGDGDDLPIWDGTVTNDGSAGDSDSGDDAGGTSDNDNTNDNSVDDGSTFTIEPDSYAEGTELTDISPHVVLSTALDDNAIAELFVVTANDDGLDRAPTGDKVFGHANVYFFNNDRRLRLDFVTPAREVSIMFAGGSFGTEETGRMEAYDSAGEKIGEYVTQPKGPGEAEQMIISSSGADIAMVLAYVATGEGSFGRMDAIVFTLDGP